MEDNPVICDCNEVCKQTIVYLITDKKLKTVDQIGSETKAGTGCGGCHSEIQDIINKNDYP